MYNELIKELRIYANDETDEIRFKAADAIERLVEERDAYRKVMTDEHNRAAKLIWDKEHCWIPVTERLPEEKTYVLILFDTIAGKMQGVCFLYKDDDGHNCWMWLDRLGKNLFGIQPTHWMPLPEPPKEE